MNKNKGVDKSWMGIARTRPAMKTSDEIYLAYFF